MKRDNGIFFKNDLTNMHSFPINIVYRNSVNPRLEFKTGSLVAIVPFEYNTGSLIEKFEGWIMKKSAFIEEYRLEGEKRQLDLRGVQNFKILAKDIVSNLSMEYEKKINGINFRKMNSRWASIRIHKNVPEKIALSLNTKMQYLPEYLIGYIIFHEMTHLAEKKHNKRFWQLINSKYINFQEMEKELYIFWFKIVMSGL